MNGRGEDVSIALVFTAQQMCAQNVLKNSVEEPNAFYYTSKLRDNYECDDEEDT